jgi:tetratricopeptide (TPR) repeat protein
LGNREQALKFLNEALAKSRENGYRLWEGQVLGLMSLVHITQGNTQQALASAQQALSISEAIGSKGMNDALFVLGLIYQSQKQYAEALDYYKRSLAISQQIRDRSAEANILNLIGSIYFTQQDFKAALNTYQQALAIHREVENRNGELTTLLQLGKLYGQQKQFQEALNTYQQALTLSRSLGNSPKKGETLLAIGQIYQERGEHTQAIETYQQALKTFRSLGDTPEVRSVRLPGEAAALGGMSLSYKQTGQSEQALKVNQEQLPIVRALNLREQEMIVISGNGLIYSERGQYPQALEALQQALGISRELKNREKENFILGFIGQAHQAQGQYPQALEAFRQALEIARAIANPEKEFSALMGIANSYFRQGQYAQALEYQQQALQVAQASDNLDNQRTALNNLGLTYDALGEYTQALQHYQQALDITRQRLETDPSPLNRASEAKFFNNIGMTYDNLGQYAQALAHYQQALVIWRELRGTFLGDQAYATEALTLNNMGLVYKSQGEYARSLEYYQQALTIQQKLNTPEQATTLGNIGVVYRDQGQYARALEYHQQALAIHQKINARAKVAANLNNIGYVYSSQGNYPQALEYFQQSLAILREIGDRPGEGLTLSNLGNLYNSKRQYADAEQSLFKAVAILESVRSSELTDEHKISLFDTQVNTYRYLQQSLIAQNKTNAALEVAERGRARAFVELLAKQLSPQSNEPTKHPSLEEIKQIAQQQNATLVEYSILPEQSLYIWVIQPTGKIDFRSVDLKTWLQKQNISLEDLVTNTRESIGVSRSIFSVEKPQSPAEEEKQTKRLQQLHQLLIEPIANLLPADFNQRVIFIPQGELFLVPFAAIQDEQGKYLIEKHTILTAPAIQVLQLTRQQKERVGARHVLPLQGDDALIVGNPTMPSVPPKIGEKPQQLTPLLGAKREAEAIASLLNTKALTGNAATETAIKAKLPQARIVHLATHGLFDDSQGLQSAIALAPDPPSSPLGKGGQEGGNGLLTAEEILKLKLNASLVILSACNTGRGRLTGDGVIGLSRSLIAAGTPSVIVSLWSVPDSPTEELMTEFYRQFQQTGNKAKALRQAMLKLKEKYPNTPKNWAAFTLIGESE